MRTFPELIPSEVRVNPPTRRVRAFVDETYDLKMSDGDLFHYLRGQIAPLSADEDRVLAHIHMVTDANGFRNSPPEKAIYEIVALGDSFTRASGVAVPWPQGLAERSGMDVLNLGDVAFGPQDELDVLKQYGLRKQPQWIILAYFEGNDLHDAASYEQANPFILLRFGRYMLNQALEAWHTRRSERDQAEVVPAYQYPVTMTINDQKLEMAFFPYYLGWLTTDRQAMESSQNFRLVREAILQMKELSETQKARFLVVYLPSKERVYLPHLMKDEKTLARVFTNVPTVELEESGFLQLTNERAAPERAGENMNGQAELLADFAAEYHIHYLDLTSIYQEEANRGAELYYPFDTHMNQYGYDLAAKAIHEYLQSQ